ncbi:GSCFA domain-containing protein [Gaoshiqia sediminis]|uniref:GSCFA domain-containing protein n=1 Tax=Gaoshiqia sediminis TaxID=2986998 RepID=A0AA41YC05_9BACT|nr:GSCFA domain-containing protein [Gaoshiqia sediminis]MCW0483400.1 GSCFA domain-containing protein [Gaoshiqia sediminis]
MDRYFTKVEIPDIGWRIGYQDKLMLIGSCFAENIGEKLQRLKFQVDLNPFGILYNPMSVCKSIRRLISGQVYQKEDLFELNGIWGSFAHHGQFSSQSPTETLENINHQLQTSHQFLKEAHYLIITFGTAWVYELKETGEVVSNCHKFPADNFKRFRLSPGEIVDEFRDLLSELWKFNSHLRILFSVSPIRHWKDGATGNQLSKATLLLAIDRLICGFGKERCAYCPSYEIVMDELRDYRFYAPDLLHISPVAVDHIWDRFSQLMIDKPSLKLTNYIMKIIRASEHKVFHPNSDEHIKFLLYNLNEIEKLTINFPYLNFENEKRHFEEELRGSQ